MEEYLLLIIWLLILFLILMASLTIYLHIIFNILQGFSDISDLEDHDSDIEKQMLSKKLEELTEMDLRIEKNGLNKRSYSLFAINTGMDKESIKLEDIEI